MWDRQHFEGYVIGGQQWKGMRKDVTKWIDECAICQKIKWREGPIWQDQIEHHLYHLDPLASLSVDTLGPLPEDENGFSFIVVIIDNFSTFVGLYPARSTTIKDFINAFMQWVGIFGVPKEIRSDGGSQFTSKLSEELSALLGIQAFSCGAISATGEWFGRKTHD